MKKYIEIFNELWEHSENEVVEFKKAETNFDIDELGKYFSALSNEANLRDHEFAWIVFGVWDKKHQIIGTTFKDGEVALNRLKQDMSQHTTDNLIFRDIVPLDIEGKRVLLFQIPASPRNIVMHWKGVAYGRDGESLKPLNQAKQDAIRQQPPIPDWTAQLVPNATISDLDELAVATAKVMFKKVHSSSIPAEEIEAWSTEEFLANSMMMREGKLTRAAILLLGKPLSIQKIHPAVAQITWTWEDEEGIVQDYEHFTIPFILTVDKVLSKIRNKTMRELPGGTLFPDTMKQYDEYTIREALHNAIAHQDYTLQQRIVFVEGPSTLYYGNGGSFIPGTIENALEHKGPQFHYRNECLCRGMVNFNMIDTVGRGIKKVYTVVLAVVSVILAVVSVVLRSFLRLFRSFLWSLRSLRSFLRSFLWSLRSFFTNDSSLFHPLSRFWMWKQYGNWLSCKRGCEKGEPRIKCVGRTNTVARECSLEK